MDDAKTTTVKERQGKSHMPAHSVFYDKVIPVLLIGMAIVTAVCILVAAGILLGFLPYR